MPMKKLVLTILIITSFACSKKESQNIHRFDLLQKIKANDSSFKDLYEGNWVNFEEHPIINCSLYHSSCYRAHRVKIIGYEVFMVEFTGPTHVAEEAKRVKGVYIGNWLFDNVKGEKPVIDFLVKTLGAKSISDS